LIFRAILPYYKEHYPQISRIEQIKENPLNAMETNLRWHDSGCCPLWI